jgi:beta-fructofuranosidase
VAIDDETRPAELIRESGDHPSATPHYRFAVTLAEQEIQLRDNPLIARFAESRERMADDPYRPAYHFVSPESHLNDPNGLTFWQGRWHLFYQGYPADEFPNREDAFQRRQHWGHAVSDDLVHWRDLPYAIYPGIEKMVFSGGAVVDGDRVVAFYPGIGTPGEPTPPGSWVVGQMVAISSDPLLLNWEKSGPLGIENAADSDIWKEGDTYVGLIGGKRRDLDGTRVRASLWTSKNLVDWVDEGELLEATTPFGFSVDEASCPYFMRIGDKHILLFFSHKYGGQYLLGDYDESRRRFRPYHHGRFNHGLVMPDGVHAPSAAMDGRGGVINILNINSGHLRGDWDHIMSLPQILTLGDDHLLRIAPVPAVESLRSAHVRVADTVIPDDTELVLPAVQGNALELALEIDPKHARRVELRVLRSPGDEEYTSLVFSGVPHDHPYSFLFGEDVVLDGSHSTSSAEVMARPPERVTVDRGGENLKLRVFIDRSVVEVFVNDRHYLAIRVYPTRDDSLGVSLRASGGEAALVSLDAWQMTPVWPV